MEKSPSREANSHSDSQEIPYLLRKSEVHFRVHKTPLLVPILSQMKPVHNFTPNFSKTYSNIILTPCLPICLVPSCFPIKILYAFLVSSMRATCLAYLIPLDLFPNNIWRSVQVRSFSLCSLLHLPPLPPS